MLVPAPSAARRAPLVWAALLVPVWAAFAYCAAREPLLRDTWRHYFWHQQLATTLGNTWEFAYDSYLHSNPRLGQTLTMLVATPGPWHALATPLVEVGLFLQLGALALGRWPSQRRTGDALLVATILALVAVTAPQLGPMLFYRPFTGNYLFGLVVSLAFILPYRFEVERPHCRRWWWIPILVIAGAAAGLCNEHTGPTVAAGACLATLAVWRRDGRPPPWMIAGFVAIVAGGLALFVAPGQEIRYNGLATHEGLLARIASRGFVGDLAIVGALGAYAWKMLAWLGLGLVGWRLGGKEPICRGRAASALACALGAFAIAATLLASPKQGQRLYFASICLLATALASVVVPMLATRSARLVAWLAAAAAIGYMLVACVRTYATAGGEFAERLAALERAPKGTAVTVAPYSLPRSRWFLGEDLGVAVQRQYLAVSFGLADIELGSAAGRPEPERTPDRADDGHGM